MRPRRPHARLILLVVLCAAAIAGALATALIVTDRHHATVETTGTAPTTGVWTPITVTRPKIPIIGGGIPVDVDPSVSRTDFSTTLFPLGRNRYRMTVFNNSTLGGINSFQWYPPVGVRILKVIASTQGRCVLTGLTGFGGAQFPTVVLYPNILCDNLDLTPATCICSGDGGSVTITFATNKGIAVNEGDLRLRAATVTFDRIPTYLTNAPPSVRQVQRIVPPTGGTGSLTAGERDDAQSALDSLQDSNISFQLVTISTRWVQSVPTACRVALESQSPATYKVYVFWVPWLAAEPYVWLAMNVTGDPKTSTFHLGASQPVLPGGRLQSNGRTVNRLSVDTTLLSRYGEEQEMAGHQLLVANGGDVFAKPGASCQVLQNGSLRLLGK